MVRLLERLLIGLSRLGDTPHNNLKHRFQWFRTTISTTFIIQLLQLTRIRQTILDIPL